MQETFLFSTTIRDNIAYGRDDLDLDAVIAAARAARAHDFIMQFPDGYDTWVGERGVTLSGGQRQRVAIARAFARNPRLLILDDATSSVDMETEFLIQQALTELMAGRTTFVIAQRLRTLKQADMILVLERGRLVQCGTHDALVEQPGLYRRIYDLQLRDQEDFMRHMAQARQPPARNGYPLAGRKGTPDEHSTKLPSNQQRQCRRPRPQRTSVTAKCMMPGSCGACGLLWLPMPPAWSLLRSVCWASA